MFDDRMDSEEHPHLTPIEPVTVTRTGRISGRPGVLEDVEISRLRVDGRYQRAMNAKSVKVVRKICADFDWSKFLPIIAVRDGDFLSIVDGQHRATAAATLGIETVPCYVLDCSRSEAAGAFAAINGNVTPVSPQDIWFARVEAGDRETLDIKNVLDAADVFITRKKEGLKVGETRSISVIVRAFHAYGGAFLCTVLQCITQTGNGNVGTLSGATINGVARALITKPELVNEPSRLFEIFDNIDFSALLDQASEERARTGNPTQFIITREVNAAISRS